MKIKVKYFGVIRSLLCGKKEEEIDVSEDTTIKQLIHKLAEKHGEEFRYHFLEKGWDRLRDNIFISLDGERIARIRGNDQQTLEGKQEVMFLSVVYTRGG